MSNDSGKLINNFLGGNRFNNGGFQLAYDARPVG